MHCFHNEYLLCASPGALLQKKIMSNKSKSLSIRKSTRIPCFIFIWWKKLYTVGLWVCKTFNVLQWIELNLNESKQFKGYMDKKLYASKSRRSTETHPKSNKDPFHHHISCWFMLSKKTLIQSKSTMQKLANKILVGWCGGKPV